MRRVQTLLVSILALLLSGCWALSIHPLYDDDTTVMDNALVGTWVEPDNDDSGTWEFAVNDEASYLFTVREPSEFSQFHMIRGHSIWKVDLSADTLKLAGIDFDWLGKNMESGRVTVASEKTYDFLVFTATTKELQKFFTTFAGEAFEPFEVMVREK
jgi:hypothetical protein